LTPYQPDVILAFRHDVGTSAASPNAAAVAILMLQANPNLTPTEVYTLLQDTAIDMQTPGFDFDSGFGYIDALAAVEAAGGTSPTTTISTSTSTSTSTPLGVPPNDLCANPRELGTLTATEAPFNVIGTTVGATVDDGFDSPCSDETMITAPGVWYTFESDLPCILASTCGDYTNYDTQISVYAGDNCDNLVCVDGNDDGGGECELKSFTGPFPAETMTRYYVLVHGFGSGEGDFSLVLSAAVGCQTPEPTKEPTKQPTHEPAKEPAKEAPKSRKGSKSKSSKSPKSTKNSKSKKIYRNLRNGYDH
jgi:hypothetical protein